MKSAFDPASTPDHLPVIVGVGEHLLPVFDASLPCAPGDLAADTGRAAAVLARGDAQLTRYRQLLPIANSPRQE